MSEEPKEMHLKSTNHETEDDHITSAVALYMVADTKFDLSQKYFYLMEKSDEILALE